MENQINVGEQNDQQIGQNAVKRINYWMVSTIILVILFLLSASLNFLNFRKATEPIPSPNPSSSPAKPVSKTSFIGTVKSGTQLGEVKSYCSNGLYLVADEGSYLDNQTKMLQLRVPNQPDGTKMFSDQKYIDKKVEVVGKYPAQENFCEALICECEDYILVDSINVATSISKTTADEWKSYQTNNFSVKFPFSWKISTRQIEYYDFPTLELTKIEGKKMFSGYELPEIWIGSFEIYSTSGAICADESYCEKAGKLSFSIKGKNYSTDVFKKQIWESGKFTGKYFYIFQIGSQSELDSIPSKPSITGQYETPAEKIEIENILSSITY